MNKRRRFLRFFSEGTSAGGSAARLARECQMKPSREGGARSRLGGPSFLLSSGCWTTEEATTTKVVHEMEHVRIVLWPCFSAWSLFYTCMYLEKRRAWLKWGVMNLPVPLPLFAAMFVIHKRFFIDLEDTSPDEKRAKWNKTVNLLVISCSKIVYVACNQRSTWPKRHTTCHCACCRFPDRYGCCPLPLGEPWLP